jgi:DnaJ like chaperone protein
MSWLGKVVGGTIGFALAGPLGAIAGAVFGHAFDTSAEDEPQWTDADARLSTLEESQLTFFVATFSMLAKLVKADGRVSQQEIDTIDMFMRRDLNLSNQGRNIATNIFQAALNSPGSFEDFARQFHQRFQSDPQMLDLVIDIMLRVAVSDGRMSSEEEGLILNAVNLFGLSGDHYNRLKSRYQPAIDRYYTVLGCAPEDSDDTIKHRYRKLVQEYHPDKIAAKGLPEEFSKFASKKFREIQEAYEEVKKQRNMK